MTEEEYNAQLQAATKFIVDSKTESVNYKESAELYKKTNDKTLEIVKESIPKTIPAEITEESLAKIANTAESAAKHGVTSSQCQMPNTERLSDNISNAVLRKVSNQMDSVIASSIERHRTQIDVRHEHHHTNMYGTFASSETNRRMMCWLAVCTILSLAQIVLFLLRWYEIIDLEWKYFPYLFFATIGIVFFGFIIRINSKPKRY